MKTSGNNLRSVLIVTNDSTVFLKKGLATAFEMFGGHAEEIKKLYNRLDAAQKKGRKMCDVSFGVITTRYGFVPGSYVIASYDDVMSSKKEYERVQQEKNFLAELNKAAAYHDRVILCVPKDMFAMILDDCTFRKGKVIAVTNPIFEEECALRNWEYFERKGTRLGLENAEKIFKIIEKES
jgi:hypothetical protein